MTNEEFTRLVRQYKDTVFRVAVNMLKSPSAADDVCQEVFLRLWRSGKRFDSDAHAKYWLIRVAVNESRRSLSSRWSRYESIDDSAQSIPFSSNEHSELFRLVMSMPAKYRIVIYLYYYEGYSTAEISKLTGAPEPTVRTRLSRGRAILKNALTEADEND